MPPLSDQDRRALQDFVRRRGVPGAPAPRPTPPASEGGAFRVFEQQLDTLTNAVVDHERRLGVLEHPPAPFFPQRPRPSVF